MSDTFWGIRCVWMRYFDVFRKNLLYGFVTSYLEPILYLVSFGFGVGRLVGDVHIGDRVVTYRQFIFSGIIAQSVLTQAFFEASYGGFVRMYYQRIFKAMASTPVTLSEVLWGELLWVGSRGTFAATATLILGCALGEFKITGALAAVPVCFFASLLFGSIGLWVAGISKSIDQIAYPQFLLVYPMFLFCGLYFPLETLPRPLYLAAWVLPLTSVASIVRTLTIGFPFEPRAVPILVFWTVLFVWLSRRTMLRRLIK